MKDDRYDIEDIERMLSPRCEFHASDELRPKIIKKAGSLSTPRRLRYIPWIAAACVAGVVIVSLMRSERSVEDAADTPCVAEVTVDTLPQSEVVSAKVEDMLIAEASAPAVKHVTMKRHSPAAVAAPEASIEPEPVEGPQDEPERPLVKGAMPMGSVEDSGVMPKILAETDIPVTRPENMEYTSEDIALMKRQDRMAYISRILLEIEIAEQSIADINI